MATNVFTLLIKIGLAIFNFLCYTIFNTTRLHTEQTKDTRYCFRFTHSLRD